jgi:hypothetical protein
MFAGSTEFSGCGLWMASATPCVTNADPSFVRSVIRSDHVSNGFRVWSRRGRANTTDTARILRGGRPEKFPLRERLTR